MAEETVDSWKQKGNDALKQLQFEDAVQCYSKGLEIAQNHVLYSNRSAAYAKLEKYTDAMKDAESAIELKPDWSKGYSRMGYALMMLERFEDAKKVYQEGLKVDPENQQLKEGVLNADEKITASRNPFNAPDMMARLRSDPRTAGYLADPLFMKNLEEIQGAPKNLAQKMSDPKILTALSVLLGVDLMTSPTEEPAGNDPLVAKEEPNVKSKPSEKMETEPANQKQSGKQEEALEAKEQGNKAYRAKRFEDALEHYDRALQLDPSNVSLLTNKAAVFFEQQQWQQCLDMCDSAVEEGRERRVDFKIIAKALARKGNVFCKQSKWAEAVKWYDKSLAEHRNKEVVQKREAAMKNSKQEQAQAYLNPEKSLEEKDLGNAAFKKGDYPSAVKHYTEAIRRNPEDPKVFSNRAACYAKLAEFTLGIKDCDECIRLDPTFVKGYLRKGSLYVALKNTSRAVQAYQEALGVDPNNQEASEGLRTCYSQDNPEERRKRAMEDPEVQTILADPAMQMILQQMQRDPAAVRDHLKNPELAVKFQKLMDAGVIQMK